jgi:hypothetical protein
LQGSCAGQAGNPACFSSDAIAPNVSAAIPRRRQSGSSGSILLNWMLGCLGDGKNNLIISTSYFVP